MTGCINVKMGVDGPDGEIIQMFDVPLDHMDGEGLANRIHSFAEAAVEWREVIANQSATEEAVVENFEHMIRI